MEGRPPVLRNSPLQIVAAELRFPEAYFLQDDMKKLRRGLEGVYPASTTEHGIGIEVTSDGSLRQQQTSPRHVYRTVDGSHQVGLTSSVLALEGRGQGYEGFETFLQRWIEVLDVVQPVAEIANQLRLGLRYINQLQVADVTTGLQALEGRVTPSLLGPLGASAFDFSISSSFQELRLQSEHGKATLRHGLQQISDPPGTSGIYLLDIDYYDDQAQSFDRHHHIETLKQFNASIWQLFRWSVTDNEYEQMLPEERQ